VKRRLEVRGTVAGVTVIDDFAHHPTAVQETLAAARARYPGRRLIGIFEPRSYTAQIRMFQDAFVKALSAADIAIVAGLFHPERYSAETAISPPEMVDQLGRMGKQAEYIRTADEIVSQMARRLEEGDVVVVMSNGSFGGIHDKLLAALEPRQR
jgi:UDP-N-acetylmuramate: L-alanyl-gamma-D-glutamyl-meso-diaminopimelate ligase